MIEAAEFQRCCLISFPFSRQSWLTQLEHTHPPHHKQREHDSISKRSVRFLRHEDVRNCPRGASQPGWAQQPSSQKGNSPTCVHSTDSAQVPGRWEQAAGPRCCLHGKPATVRRFHLQLSAPSHLRDVLPANVGSVCERQDCSISRATPHPPMPVLIFLANYLPNVAARHAL